MPRIKYATDEERVAAIRAYHKRYHEAHREALTARSRQWRADQKLAQAAPALPPVEAM